MQEYTDEKMPLKMYTNATRRLPTSRSKSMMSRNTIDMFSRK